MASSNGSIRSIQASRSIEKPAAAILAAAFLAIYLPDLGHGLIKDDYAWIAQSTLVRPVDALRLFLRAPSGFYRPLASLAFAIDRALFGLHPFGYALTNLLLALAAATMLLVTARRMGLAAGAALFAAAVWLFNVHGINMAVLWASGRTSLLVTTCALGAAASLLRGGRWSVAGWTLAALWCKESAVLLPVMLLSWAVILIGRDAWRRTWPAFLALGAYLLVRMRTGAMTPRSAPSYYRFTFAPSHLLVNVLQYADRACTWPAVILLLLFLLVRRRPSLRPRERRIVLAGCVWLVLGYAITVFLPVRSSLYACLPSVGAALMAAAMATAVWREASPALRPRLVIAALVLPFVLWPLYHARNARWVGPADRATRVLAGIAPRVQHLPAGSLVVVDDEERGRTSVNNVFSGFLPLAVELTTGRPLDIVLRTSGVGPRTLDVGPRTPLHLLIAADGSVH